MRINHVRMIVIICVYLLLISCKIVVCIDNCQYKYPEKHDPNKIRLCVSSRWVPWLNTSIGMIVQ